MQHGVDVSNHQPNWRPAANDRYVFILTSDGHTWKSPTHDAQVILTRAAKRVVGHYHWLRPGNIQAQADWFWTQANPRPGDVLICDWEQSGTTNRDKDDFIRAVQAKVPKTKILRRPKNRVLLYCNRNYWLNYDKTSFVGDGLWIAAYGVDDPGIQFPWLFWQYADGPVTDQNRARFNSKSDLVAWTKPATPTPAPAPVPAPVAPIQPTLNAIHTPFGQWGPSWSWNRGKNKQHPTWGQHGGDDWHRGAGMAEIGDPIYAVAAGRVIYAGDARKTDAGWGSAFGIHVLIQWDTGGRTSIDAHMSKLHVKTGDRVKAGDLIGEKGMTGNVSGPHDHHEQHLGTRWTDPRVKPIYPGALAAPAPKPAPDQQPVPPDVNQEELDVATQQPAKHRTKDQIVKPTKRGSHKLLYLDDRNNVSWAFGPGRYEVVSYIRFRGIDANAELLVKAAIIDTDRNGKVVKSQYKTAVGLPGGSGTSFRQFVWRWNVGHPAKGTTRRLRLAVQNFTGKDIKVTEIYTYVWKATL